MSDVKPVAAKPVSVAQTAPAKVQEATQAKAAAPAQPTETKEKAARRGKTSELAGKQIFLVEAKIREKMPEGRTELNPKREGSNGHKAFSLYRNGMTVEEFVKVASEKEVGSMADIRWDKDHGFIELKDAPSAAVSAAPVPAAQPVAPATVAPKA